MQALDQNIGLALIHQISPQEALERTAARWEEITNRYGREHQKEHYHQWKRQLEALGGGR
ncbi:hypothetical protein CULT_500032 [[Clostridium] ultunense Esp]|nr:hypothetical protein CULT_500032 [[Clostridium] ultunense Esp]